MPADDNGCIHPDDTKRTRTLFYEEHEYDDVPLSPTNSTTTDYLEDSLIPAVITPLSSSASSSIESLSGASSDESLIIPLYMFHVVERTSLNIEFNRCLQLSLLHVNEDGKFTAEVENIEDGIFAISVDEINIAARETGHIPVIQLDSEAFDELLERINNNIEEFDDPELLMELVIRYLYEIELKIEETEGCIPGWSCGDRQMLVPPYQYDDPDENDEFDSLSWSDASEESEEYDPSSWSEIPGENDVFDPSSWSDESEETDEYDSSPITEEQEETEEFDSSSISEETQENEEYGLSSMSEEPEESEEFNQSSTSKDLDENEEIIPSYLFEEPEEIEVLVPPFLFYDDDDNTLSDQIQHENILNMLAGGDFNDIDELVPFLADKLDI